MTRLTALMALLVTLTACFPENPNPTSPGPGPYTLSGTVFAGGHLLSGVSVTIMDGIHAGQARTTDGFGRYIFEDLAASAFTLRATTLGYGAQNKAVNLTSNQFLSFDLPDH